VIEGTESIRIISQGEWGDWGDLGARIGRFLVNNTKKIWLGYRIESRGPSMILRQRKGWWRDWYEEFAPIRRAFSPCRSILVISAGGCIRFSVGFVKPSAGGFQIFWIISRDCWGWFFLIAFILSKCLRY